MIAWARPEQEALLREAIDVAEVELIAVGCDQREGAADLARSFDVERLGDVRAAIQHPEIDLLLLAAPAPIDPGERRLIRELKVRTVSLEPRPGEVSAMVHEPAEAETARFIPLMRRGDGFRSARQVLADLPPPHGLHLTCRARPHEGTLFARLFDAMDLIDHLCGNVESVSASLADPDYDATAAGQPAPDALIRLRGHMSINLHFTENRCASALISNESDGWFRGLTMLTGEGCLHITDRDCRWSAEPEDTVHSDEAVSAGRLLGESIRRVLDELDRDDPPPNCTRLLALCEAARLSCRTGQAESPSRMLAMMSHV